MRKVPIWMVEPSSSMARLTMAPSTQVPLREPRSSTVSAPGARCILAWWRETVMSLRNTVLEGSRPMVTSGVSNTKVVPVWGPLTMESVGLARRWAPMRSGTVASVDGIRKMVVESDAAWLFWEAPGLFCIDASWSVG